METLPDELLLEIFVYLPVPDLHSIALTCHKFNSIVSTSSKILDRFEVQFTIENINKEWIGSRRYTRFFVNGPAGYSFFYVMKNIHQDIDYLIINCYDMRIDILKQIILMFSKIRNLTVYNVASTYDADPEDYEHPFIQQDFHHFYYQGEINAFKLFSQCTVKALDVRRVNDDDFKDVDGLKSFLKVQKHLDELKLENFHQDCCLFKDEQLTAVDFRLKKLKVKNFDGNGCNLWEFLEFHKDTLLHLEAWTVSHDAMSFFRRFKSLKTLKLSSMCSDFNVLHTVETVYLKNVHGKWSEKVPNVKNLVIAEHVEDFQQISALKCLESVKFNDCLLPVLCLNLSVKKVTLNRVELDGGKPFEYENGCEIEELEISRCKNVDWLLDFLIWKEFKVKSLVVRKSIMIEDDIKFIEEHRGRIERLEIKDCSGLSEEDIDDDESTSCADFSECYSSEEEEEEGSSGDETEGTDSEGESSHEEPDEDPEEEAEVNQEENGGRRRRNEN